jgi:hypothetical protein
LPMFLASLSYSPFSLVLSYLSSLSSTSYPLCLILSLGILPNCFSIGSHIDCCCNFKLTLIFMESNEHVTHSNISQLKHNMLRNTFRHNTNHDVRSIGCIQNTQAAGVDIQCRHLLGRVPK